MGKSAKKGGFSFASLLMLLCAAGIIVSFFVLPALKLFESKQFDTSLCGIDYIKGIFGIEPDTIGDGNVIKYASVKLMIATGDSMNMASLIFVYAFFGAACIAAVVALLSLITTFHAGTCKKLLAFLNFLLMVAGVTAFVCLLVYNKDLGAELDQVGICMYIVAIASVASFVFSMFKKSSN